LEHPLRGWKERSLRAGNPYPPSLQGAGLPLYYITTRRKGERKYGHTENFSVSIPELGEIRWKSSLSDGTFAWYNTLVKKELVPAVERFLEKE
jgi:hypothetical protein